MKAYSKIISVEVYCRDILFHFGDVRSLKRTLRKYHTQEQTEAIIALADITNNTMGKCVYDQQNNVFVVWLPSLPQSVADMQFLSHEIFHAVCAIMIGIGVPLSDDSEEAYAYLTGYITRKVLEAFPIFLFGERSGRIWDRIKKSVTL